MRKAKALRINSDNIGKSAVKIGIIPLANGIGAVRTESSASFCLSSIPQALLPVNTFAKIYEIFFPRTLPREKVCLKTDYFVPKSLSPASPRPGTIYACSLSFSSSAAV